MSQIGKKNPSKREKRISIVGVYNLQSRINTANSIKAISFNMNKNNSFINPLFTCMFW